MSSKTLIFLFYLMALIFMAVHGIVAGAVMMVLLPLELTGIMLLGMLMENIIISLLVLYLCRNLLQYAELNNR